MRYTPNRQAVNSFSVASSRKYTTAAGEHREETEWFDCSAFGKRTPVTSTQPRGSRFTLRAG